MWFVDAPENDDVVDSSDGSVVCLDPVERRRGPVEVVHRGKEGVMLWDSRTPATVGQLAEAYWKRSSPGKTVPKCNLVVRMKGDQIAPEFYSNDDDVVLWRGAGWAELVPR